VEFGVAIFPTEDVQDPPELARMAEQRGFESLMFPEHTHIPASRESPYSSDDGELPPEYSRAYDPFVALAAAAAATERIRIGTAICLVIQRDPIITAKEVASIDCLSHGRFLFGVGAGWNAEEMRNHGTDLAQRFGVMRERIEAMKAIWAEDEATYSGQYVSFDRIWCWPKPVQKPHPPVLVGGNGRQVINRVVAYGDGWIPNEEEDEDENLASRIGELQHAAAEAGRSRITVTLSGSMRDPRGLERLEQAGVHRLVSWLPAHGRDAVERAMDDYVAGREAYQR
jgi:probable F420-dependent oxidoreductase